MKKYYVIDVFLVKRIDKLSYLNCIHESNASKLIVTKTFGGFKEIKTGRFIPDLSKSGEKVKYNSYSYRDQFVFKLPLSLKKDVLTNGAILIAISESMDYFGEVYHDTIVHRTIRPVESLEEIKEYLSTNTAEEVFERLDNIRKDGFFDYIGEKRNIRKTSVQKKFKGWLKKIQSSVEKKQIENQLMSNIEEEIKKRK